MNLAPPLCALLALALSFAQDAPPPAHAPERELFPDGSLHVERSVIVEKGVRIADGPYKRMHENGKVACTGSYERGLLSGKWQTFHEGGEPRTSGEFARGARFGRWEMHWKNGQLAVSGGYDRGLRNKKWAFRDEQGQPIEADSGSYEAVFGDWFPEVQQRTSQAERLGEKLHGRATSFWIHGGRKLDGEFVHGVRQGPWTLRHYDGSIEADYLTGWYVDGALADEGEAHVDPFAIPEELEARERELHHATDDAPRFPRGFGLKPKLPDPVFDQIETFKSPIEPEKADELEAQILARGKQALPDAITALVRLDLDQPEQAEGAGRIVDKLLVPILGERGWRWSRVGDGGDAARNRKTVLRWYTWFDFARDDETYWTWLEKQPKKAPLLSPELVDRDYTAKTPPKSAPPVAANAPAAKSIWRASDLTRARAKSALEPDAQKALDAALKWIVAHQARDGGWYPGKLIDSCGRIGEGKCEDRGDAELAPAATGVCVLALLGAGNGPVARREAVEGAVKWLLSQQGADGLIGAKGPECYYNHALATWALAEAAQAIDSPELLARVERAVKYALAALSGVRWKYTEAPNGESDATLTAQMVCALGAAWDAGIDFPREKLHAANDWLEDDEPEDAKCVAPAMYARLATEPSSKYHQYAVGQTEVLLKDLPAWPDEPKGLDFGYWFWSSQGMAAALEASRRDKWRTPLLEALLERQQRGKSDLAGSFDPLDARRATLGRLGSTALLALALEAPVRTAR